MHYFVSQYFKDCIFYSLMFISIHYPSNNILRTLQLAVKPWFPRITYICMHIGFCPEHKPPDPLCDGREAAIFSSLLLCSLFNVHTLEHPLWPTLVQITNMQENLYLYFCRMILRIVNTANGKRKNAKPNCLKCKTKSSLFPSFPFVSLARVCVRQRVCARVCVCVCSKRQQKLLENIENPFAKQSTIAEEPEVGAARRAASAYWQSSKIAKNKQQQQQQNCNS